MASARGDLPSKGAEQLRGGHTVYAPLARHPSSGPTRGNGMQRVARASRVARVERVTGVDRVE